MSLKAYSVSSVSDYEGRSWVVFAENNRTARYAGYHALQDIIFSGVEYIDVRAHRAPEFDKYAMNGEVTDQDYLNEGWGVTCCKCEKMVHQETPECIAEDPELTYAVVIDSKVYCNKCAAKMKGAERSERLLIP